MCFFMKYFPCQEHYNRLQDPRARSQVSIKKRSVDKRKLQDVLEGSDEPAVGLENIVEWWPFNDKVCVTLSQSLNVIPHSRMTTSLSTRVRFVTDGRAGAGTRRAT